MLRVGDKFAPNFLFRAEAHFVAEALAWSGSGHRIGCDHQSGTCRYCGCPDLRPRPEKKPPQYEFDDDSANQLPHPHRVLLHIRTRTVSLHRYQ